MNSQCFSPNVTPNAMPGIGWRCVEAAAGLLTPLEREVVLGDLAEADCHAWRGLSDVLGLAMRRHIALWKSWRPWAASLGLAWPASLCLMGMSIAASKAVARLAGAPLNASLLQDVSLLWISISQCFLLICWAWMAGFAMGAISRRTLWASALGCCAPCLFCLSEWPGHGVSGLQLLLFVLPAIWGVRRGRQGSRLALGWALFLAATALLALVMWSKDGWHFRMYGCALLWPGWYLVMAACRKREPV